MWKTIIIKAILAIAIIGGGIMVIIKDDPATPTRDINRIQPLPEQSDP